MRDRVIVILLFCSVAAGTLFHLHEKLVPPAGGILTPFPLLPDFEIHSEPYAHMGLWRVRLMLAYAAITALAFATRKYSIAVFGTILFFLEEFDLIDYLLRYGQDFFASMDDIDANVAKMIVFGLSIPVTYYLHGKSKKRA